MDFVLTLHGHLPYVLHHGRWPHGSVWLCEAAFECYLPLLEVLHRLVADGISPRWSINLSPVLTEQLAEEPRVGEAELGRCEIAFGQGSSYCAPRRA